MNATEIREVLRNEVAEVFFTKKDGSMRKMFCTLLPEYLPDFGGVSESMGTTVESEDNITVWDLEVQGWRSFRTDSVISLESDSLDG